MDGLGWVDPRRALLGDVAGRVGARGAASRGCRRPAPHPGGADRHAPPGSPGLAAVRRATVEAGLAVSSCGTYWRAGRQRAVDAAPLEAAVTLGAPRLRVRAGDRGTTPGIGDAAAVADDDWWDLVVADLRELCHRAAPVGLEVSLEFHPGTLTDTVATTRQLLERVHHEALSTYWQPRIGEEAELAVQGLAELLDVVSAVHVFSWLPHDERLPLGDRADLWTGVLEVLTTRREPIDLLLESVPDDDITLLGRQSATLRGWLERGPTSSSAPPGRRALAQHDLPGDGGPGDA